MQQVLYTRCTVCSTGAIVEKALRRTVTAWARPLQPRHRRRADTVSKVKAFRELGSFKRSREDPSAQKKETLEDSMSTLMCFYLLE